MGELTLKAIDENLDTVLSFIDGELNAANFQEDTKKRIDIAVCELFTNIAHYAYGDTSGNVVVNIEIFDSQKTAVITFTDWGAPFNPLEAKDPDISLSADEREVGGLGIHIVKNIMDDVCYEYADGKNILKIVKIMD